MAKKRNWDLHWMARLSYLSLEAAEFAESLRGKGGIPVDEAGDTLLCLMLFTESVGIPWEDVLASTRKSCSLLETKPRYEHEEVKAE